MRKSQRPVTVRVASSSGGRSAALKSRPKKSKEDFYLPEDEDEAPRSRNKGKKRRGKDEFIDNTYEAMQQELTEILESEASGSKKVSSKFKKSFKQFQEKLDPNNPDFRIEQSSNHFNRSTLEMLVDLIPIAEENFRQTKKETAAYALVALVKQVEDVQNSIRMNDDVEGRIAVIHSLVQAAFVRLADILIRSKFDMHQAVDELISDAKKRQHIRHALDNMVQSMGKPLEEYKKHLQTQIALYMTGDPSYLNPEAAMARDEPKKKRKKKKK